jgi:hypothetical protein
MAAKKLKKKLSRILGIAKKEVAPASPGRNSLGSIGSLTFANPNTNADAHQRPRSASPDMFAGANPAPKLVEGIAHQAEVKGKRFGKGMANMHAGPSKALDERSLSSVMSRESVARAMTPAASNSRATSPVTSGHPPVDPAVVAQYRETHLPNFARPATPQPKRHKAKDSIDASPGKESSTSKGNDSGRDRKGKGKTKDQGGPSAG